VATLSGPGPIGFTWTFKGEQLFIPLTAFTLTGSTVGFDAAWNGVFTGNDASVLLALAQGRYASGELTATALPPSVPAVAFTAVSAGVNGNDIVVTVTPGLNAPASGPVTVVNSSLGLEATQTLTYPGLASAAAAAGAIGSNTAPTSPADPPLGTGLVQVVGAPSNTTDLPEAKSYTLNGTTAEPILATDGSTLFEVVAAQPAPAPGAITVTVSLDTGGPTFTLASTYDSGAGTLAYQDLMSPLPAALAFLVTAAAPAGGFAVPASGLVQLSGGAADIPASAIAYTPAPTS
jgi:hypothetical protein